MAARTRKMKLFYEAFVVLRDAQRGSRDSRQIPLDSFIPCVYSQEFLVFLIAREDAPKIAIELRVDTNRACVDIRESKRGVRCVSRVSRVTCTVRNTGVASGSRMMYLP